MGLSVLPLGWNGDLSKGMPSVYLMQKGLKEAGYQTHYVLLGDFERAQYECIEGIHIHRYPMRIKHCRSWAPFYYLSDWIYWVCCQYQGVRILRDLADKYNPDVYVGHTRYCIFPARFVSRQFGKPCLFREYGTNNMYKAIKSLVGKMLLFPRILSFKVNSDVLVLTDDGTQSKEVALALGVPECKIRFWKNGIFDVHEVSPKDIDEKRTVVCTAARLSPEKHIDSIIKSIAESKNKDQLTLYILGDGPQEESLKELVAKLGLEDQVRFAGGVSREDVIAYFKASDIVISLGSINPLLESMACGRAVITLDLGTTGEIVKHLDNGIIVNQPDPKEIADYIDYLCSNPGIAKELGDKAQVHVRQEYMVWDRRIEQEISLIENIIGV